MAPTNYFQGSKWLPDNAPFLAIPKSRRASQSHQVAHLSRDVDRSIYEDWQDFLKLYNEH